jgi:peptidoglycan/LPS O-acetylase OafA/YrhL
MTAARVAYYVLVVQLSLLLFVVACYWGGHDHGWTRVFDFTAAVVAWFGGTGALGTLRRDKP